MVKQWSIKTNYLLKKAVLNYSICTFRAYPVFETVPLILIFSKLQVTCIKL